VGLRPLKNQNQKRYQGPLINLIRVLVKLQF
jgi:hypothetical protein